VNAPGHVLMTADAVGGVWTYAVELSRALAGAGTRVTLATFGPRPTTDQRVNARRIPNLDLHEFEGKLEWMDDPWADVAAAGDWLVNLAHRIQPDLVHLNDFSHGARAWPCPAVVVAHSCVVSWWNAVHGSGPPPQWAGYRQSVRAGLLGADAAAAVSHAMADAVSLHYGVPAPTVVWNGRRASEYRPAEKEDLILASGRAWDEAKNIAALDAAADRVAWPVYVAGEAQRPQGGTADLHRLRSLGKLSADSLREWFSRASIYALPALYEPFGLSILEAALCGCALVLGDIPSLRELWDGAAVFVDGRDAGAVAAAINGLIADSEARAALVRHSRSRALNLTPERMVKGYLRVYSQARATYFTNREPATSCAS
jgi:glycogen synthase